MSAVGLDSGPAKGEPLSAFEPTHVTGQDAGTETCPVCKYGNLPAVQVWVNGLPGADAEKIAINLDKRMGELNGERLRFKSFVIVKSGEGEKVEGTLRDFAKSHKLGKVALTWLPAASEALAQYKINPEAETTVLVYKNRHVSDKFVNLKADVEGIKRLNAAIDKITK